MEEAEIRKRIQDIFDDTRIDYEGVYEPKAEDKLIELIEEIKEEVREEYDDSL